MLKPTNRIVIRQTDRGYLVCSGAGMFGTKIRVRHFATALAIKATLKRLPRGPEQMAVVDALILDEPKDGYPLIPASRIHLVWSR